MKTIEIKWVAGLVIVFAVALGVFWWWQRLPGETTALTPVPPTTLGSEVGSPASSSEETAAVIPQSGVRLLFSPTNGQVVVWRFEVHSRAEIDFTFMQPKLTGGSASTPPPGMDSRVPVSSAASGDLYLKYYLREPGVWNVAGLIQNLDFRINGEKLPFVAAIGEPFVFTMDSQGRFQDFRFVRGLPDQASGFVKNTLLSMQIVLPKEEQRVWSTVETDLTGRYRANYHIRKLVAKDNVVVIGKEKQAYLGLNSNFTGAQSAIASSTARVVQTDGTMTMPLKGPWLTSMDCKEKITLVAGAYEWSKVSIETTLAMVNKNTAGLFPEKFGQFAARLETDHYLQAKYYATDPNLDQMGVGLNVDGAVSLFLKITQSSESNSQRFAEKFMVNYLRQHPGACAELIALMNQDSHRERVDENTQLIFWRLLTKAGHPEAQEAVVRAIADSSQAEVTRIRALTAIHNFEYPQPFLVDDLYRHYQKGGSAMAGAQTEQTQGMVLLAIGSLGYGEKLNEETQAKVGKLLVDHLGTTKTIAKQVEALMAIGNYGGKEMVPKIEPFLSSADPLVRATAFTSMRRMDDPGVMHTLIKHYEQETDTRVRAAALKTLAEFTPTPEGEKWVNRNALTERPSEEQALMVGILGKNRQKNPENGQTLKKMLQNNPDNRVKREIYKYIVPGQ